MLVLLNLCRFGNLVFLWFIKLTSKLLKHGCSWHLLNPERCVCLRPATRHGASLCHFGIERCCREGGIEELCCCGGTAVSAPWIPHLGMSYSYIHTDIYRALVLIVFTPRVREVVFFKSRGLLGIQVKNNEESVRYSNKHFALHDNISHNYTNECVYILLYFWKPFHQLRFCPPRMFSSTSALLGLSRSADYSASNANLLLGFAWDRLLEGKIGKKSVEFWCGLNSTPRSWKFQMMKHWSSQLVRWPNFLVSFSLILHVFECQIIHIVWLNKVKLLQLILKVAIMLGPFGGPDW